MHNIIHKSNLDILILHDLPPKSIRRSAVEAIELMFPKNASNHNYIVHNCSNPMTEYIKNCNFDAIILGSTFLWQRAEPDNFLKLLTEYDFIRKSNAFKIAMPQDDYFCNKILDDWMCGWGVDLVYTVIPQNWSVLYPRYIKTKGKIMLGYTGYISEDMIKYWKSPKKHNERTIDVSYRSHWKHANYGQLGFMKAYIGVFFKTKFSDKNLVLDISTNPSDMIPGNNWYEFVENSKFCITINSGHNFLDPYGDIKRTVDEYQWKNPQAEYKEIEQQCYPGIDGKYDFTAISPRVIEAALAETVQLAVPGNYSGILKPMVHYIPLRIDSSNVDEVYAIMNDENLVHQIAKNCKKAILNHSGLRAKEHVENTINIIKSRW